MERKGETDVGIGGTGKEKGSSGRHSGLSCYGQLWWDRCVAERFWEHYQGSMEII